MSIIRDRHSQEYHVNENDSAGFKRFNIECSGNLVGYVNCHFEGEVLHIDDLRIYDKAMRLPLFFVDLFFWIGSFPPQRWRITNYQNRGLGTAMIEFLAGYARRKSAKRIEGEVKPHDFKANPQLPEWYRHRGFTVVMGDGKAAAVARVSLAL
jgi:GNAT superfamily N-acetyltransferase